MRKYKCTWCGYIYDPEKGDPTQGIPIGTSFEDLPETWLCPVCHKPRHDFFALTEET